MAILEGARDRIGNEEAAARGEDAPDKEEVDVTTDVEETQDDSLALQDFVKPTTVDISITYPVEVEETQDDFGTPTAVTVEEAGDATVGDEDATARGEDAQDKEVKDAMTDADEAQDSDLALINLMKDAWINAHAANVAGEEGDDDNSAAVKDDYAQEEDQVTTNLEKVIPSCSTQTHSPFAAITFAAFNTGMPLPTKEHPSLLAGREESCRGMSKEECAERPHPPSLSSISYVSALESRDYEVTG